VGTRDGVTTQPYAYRPALDGVRAFAVVAVLAFHGGVGFLPGGFLGVDAFFVLSGFLITSLLLAESARSGRIDLPAFWGRRARRLLPALLVMLVAVAAVSRVLVPAPEWPGLRADALAAVAYLANWRMMDRGGDYFAATAPPSPLQHTWSLGIEEQFYLLWPLVLLAVMALVRRPAARPRAVLGLCVAGGVASALAAAVLYDPRHVDRDYYGTDTRAVALLVGCGLAALLAGRPAEGDARRHRLLGGLALAGVVLTAALWATAGGGAGWLYRGGLTVAALATAAVIAHAVASPRSPTARFLSLAPLVAIGRISYGLYLWHWPLFQWLSGSRTGLTGTPLLAARFAATAAVAVASYLLVEMPIRTARWPRGRPLVATGAAASAAAATAAVAVLATVPPAVPAPAPPISLAQALAGTPGPAPSSPAPIDRPGRRPGALPRIDVFGDSVAWSLGTYLPPQAQLAVKVRAVQGCGIARLPDIVYVGEPHTNYPGCEQWDQRWRNAVRADDPDLSVILLDRWELMDRRLDGTYQHVGEPAFDAYLVGELDLAITIASARGAHVVLLTAPYTHRAERPDGSLFPEDDPARVDAWNALLRGVAARRGATVLDLNARVCPQGRFAWSVDGIRVRSDGLHFTPQGVQDRIAPWLLPELARLAVHGP
jgi:peptidoglycan/LPS O-acetylase OafA/YrhL